MGNSPVDPWQVSARAGDVWFCVEGQWCIVTVGEAMRLATRLLEVAESYRTDSSRTGGGT